MIQLKPRNLHRDLGYFYIGLIISFAFSGLLMNHRDSWHPEKYTVETKQIAVAIFDQAAINDVFVEKLAQQLKIDDKIRRHKVKKDVLKVSFEKNDLEIELKTGKGELVRFNKTPIISHAMGLHKNTSNWWIYYSDLFAISLITIAITGTLMIPAGKFSFKQRGWKLALLGLIVPILILIFIV
jgi:hypothetical protein